ncbi:DUF2752 domain-containing protein [Myroides injenensis]|uniref:DUF2752 domain-containing protein n=1 Tax=Myroides injenensis TaxID=1183151 RepID=UPI000288048F|nr:DUF2752 domain-containing protein [Myroides injenensis]
MKAWLIRGFFVLSFILVIVFYYRVNLESPLVMSCVFYDTTGLECPGCGGQRAVKALLMGEFKDAFYFNPLIYIYIPMLILLSIGLLEVYIIKNEWFIKRFKIPSWFGVLFIVAILSFFIIRNLDKFL